jgi:hypothetical protein
MRLTAAALLLSLAACGGANAHARDPALGDRTTEATVDTHRENNDTSRGGSARSDRHTKSREHSTRAGKSK